MHCSICSAPRSGFIFPRAPDLARRTHRGRAETEAAKNLPQKAQKAQNLLDRPTVVSLIPTEKKSSSFACFEPFVAIPPFLFSERWRPKDKVTRSGLARNESRS